MEDISKIHDEVLKFLISYREKNPRFTFGLRSQNNDNRLKKGYWFNGNEQYVAIAFWTGTDWKNKTPNIFFKIKPDGSSFLEFSFMDSPDKRLLIDRIKENVPDIEKYKRGYIKKYTSKNYLIEIEQFLIKDKPIIDALIILNSDLFDAVEKRYNRVTFFSNEEFTKMLQGVNLYRENKINRNI